jgi:hypothetical protein
MTAILQKSVIEVDRMNAQGLDTVWQPALTIVKAAVQFVVSINNR